MYQPFSYKKTLCQMYHSTLSNLSNTAPVLSRSYGPLAENSPLHYNNDLDPVRWGYPCEVNTVIWGSFALTMSSPAAYPMGSTHAPNGYAAPCPASRSVGLHWRFLFKDKAKLWFSIQRKVEHLEVDQSWPRDQEFNSFGSWSDQQVLT